MYSESGLFANFVEVIKRKCMEYIMKKNRIYRTPGEYVDDLVSFDNLGLGNFYGIFRAYLVFCLIVFIAFVVHLMAKFILSRRRRIEFTIYLNYQRLVNLTNRIVFCF